MKILDHVTGRLRSVVLSYVLDEHHSRYMSKIRAGRCVRDAVISHPISYSMPKSNNRKETEKTGVLKQNLFVWLICWQLLILSFSKSTTSYVRPDKLLNLLDVPWVWATITNGGWTQPRPRSLPHAPERPGERH